MQSNDFPFKHRPSLKIIYLGIAIIIGGAIFSFSLGVSGVATFGGVILLGLFLALFQKKIKRALDRRQRLRRQKIETVEKDQRAGNERRQAMDRRM